VACATKNAKGNKCQTGHRHNGTAITLAVIAKFGEALEAGAAKPCRILALNDAFGMSAKRSLSGAKRTSTNIGPVPFQSRMTDLCRSVINFAALRIIEFNFHDLRISDHGPTAVAEFRVVCNFPPLLGCIA
jgi:hypothetical protein